MDRFIVSAQFRVIFSVIYLKSNMDRFIEIKRLKTQSSNRNLKSNMDRFIASSNCCKFIKLSI